MKLSEVKTALSNIEQLKFILPNGSFIPAHFHITEVGLITKKFIDCGGTVREDQVINFQLWEDEDYDHRLTTEKFLNIINLSEKTFDLPDIEIEVEYQTETISKFGLEYDNDTFLLTSKMTDCLAPDKCGIPQQKPLIRISANGPVNSCEPGSGCC